MNIEGNIFAMVEAMFGPDHAATSRERDLARAVLAGHRDPQNDAAADLLQRLREEDEQRAAALAAARQERAVASAEAWRKFADDRKATSEPPAGTRFVTITDAETGVRLKLAIPVDFIVAEGKRTA